MCLPNTGRPQQDNVLSSGGEGQCSKLINLPLVYAGLEVEVKLFEGFSVRKTGCLYCKLFTEEFIKILRILHS